MRNQRNKWILTDNDCCQCVKRDDNTKYHMIQYVELDLEENNFIVVKNEIDLLDYTNDDIASHLESYGYNIIKMLLVYQESCIDLIAECILENTIIDNENIIAEFRTEKEAVDFIEKYIEIDNYTEV